MRFILFLSLLTCVKGLATTCYTDCTARFPKWYQEPDRKRCQVEKARACLDPSGLPGNTPLSEYDHKFKKLSDRLLTDFLENGYVVSRKEDGGALHHGDSLIWSGLAMAALPCEEASVIRDAITRSVHRNDGRFLRIDPLPDSFRGNETSRDAEVGALFGFTIHSLRCPGSKAQLARAWAEHREFVESHDGRLHEGSNANFYMNPALKYIWDLTSHALLGTARPSDESRALFESGVLISTKSVSVQKSACYPVHLSTLLLILAKKLGKPVNHLTRREFCHETRGMELPLTEWYCESGSAGDFLRDFKTDKWEYRHQRCPSWESPDVDRGESSPAVDFLLYKTVVEGS